MPIAPLTDKSSASVTKAEAVTTLDESPVKNEPQNVTLSETPNAAAPKGPEASPTNRTVH